jgi:4-methyl-5(b-hydroxyethyl)-thiazole monophosphate biosynthesis
MKTLAIFYPGCVEFEVLLACEILNKDFPVEIATPDGKDHLGSNGMVFKASKSFESVIPSEYKAILVPGGDPGSVIGNQRLSQIIKECYLNNSVLGAICAGPIVLEQAGILKNQRIAHGYKGRQLQFIQENGFFNETQLTNEPFIVGDRIVTARADSFIDFAVEVARLVGSVSDSRAAIWKNYYKGNPSTGAGF